MSDQSPLDLDHFRALLTNRLAEIEALAQSSKESRAPVTLDQQSVGRLSRMDAMQGQAMALATEQRRTTERHRIRAALARIDSGDYGYCLKCGDEIPAKRLQLDPATPVCVDCVSGPGPAGLGTG
ncbi:MAG TPA: molecular chaperone DnaK [Rhodospirillaceae bacterium]|jgi:DnaK suppressor protein|nr:molecular chaperone DnaK [Rhodospirillaceae bacterium]MAX63450.1 molecular chaperone DnaK [Rhodospirillaceae bacterium]MBB59229.1 molecular chaperone DnaK [Rhodospirillaceae bacterium]HAJ22057.1 molecular chaperone DnaK [Rhodospirillaceae bacterium]|tara:strand:+ start:2030 stop:2404 length:375 start_codon:yes stop_codon:yes gene_type:complete